MSAALIDYLKKLGFTVHESKLYLALYHQGALTGYEAAKLSSIPRANAYTSLSTLVEKGGAVKIEGEPLRFQAIPFEELAANILRKTTEVTEAIQQLLPPSPPPNEPFVTLEGDQHILHKVVHMIETALRTVYLDAWQEDIPYLKPYLQHAHEAGKKVVVITVGPAELGDIWSYTHSREDDWQKDGARPIRVITDSTKVLIGEIGKQDLSRGIFSQNASLINLVKESFIHDILLIEITNRFGKELTDAFGKNLKDIRKRISRSRNPVDQQSNDRKKK